ncbi:hypothetical protein HMPREF9104_02157 [Lentilactobacillus kisonensis F0435]|uniref:Uncharacterized protein n=1 Tax=Lentilactobacillus kisonensis F0435 TaxID=797516 RepID=H1LHR6_9LACO|nr:hypothetical protein HMPREF9104_02157 [Lentilactobacillus kisonensis F0435]
MVDGTLSNGNFVGLETGKITGRSVWVAIQAELRKAVFDKQS